MAFKLNRTTAATPESPEALFRDLRNRKIAGPLAHQADMLRLYQRNSLNSRDVALQLPTGSGKTLVGLLIAEWRRRMFNEKVVYLCPTKQLVNQVVDQSVAKYGIQATAFTGQQSKYPPDAKAKFDSAERIAVTTYNGLFNTNPYFSNPDVIILDDAHAAENYISQHWSLLIERKEHKEIFEAIVSVIRPFLSVTDQSRLILPSDRHWDINWIDKLPTPRLIEIEGELTAILDSQAPGTKNLQYPWSVLRDHLHACHMYLCVNAFLIRPIIPPTFTHAPFANAKQRLYMSATLGEGGDLERITGIKKIDRLPIPDGWDKQGIGRRLFFFPERSLTDVQSLDLVMEMVKSTPRALALVPDDRSAKALKEKLASDTNYSVFSAEQLEQAKGTFTSTTGAVAVVANRYDGIDMLDDECRLLIVQGLPRAMNMQEKFIVTRLAATVLLNDRILTRIVQAVGRCTRSPTDFAAVVVLGEELNKHLSDPKRRGFLHPEMQAELKFGIEESTGVNRTQFLDNLRIFFEHKKDWDQADEAIIAVRDEMLKSDLPAMDKLMASVPHEVDYLNAIWSGDFERAVEKCQSVLSALSGDDVMGYRAFWSYLCGSAAWMGAERGIASLRSIAREQFKRAAAGTTGVRWLLDLAKLGLAEDVPSSGNSHTAAMVEGLETELESHGTANDRRFEAAVANIVAGISQNSSKRFEVAHENLGRLLGFDAARVEADAAPDCWWTISDELCIVFEDHSDANSDATLGATKVRQAASHVDWIRHNVSALKKATIFTVLISPATKIEKHAIPYAKDVLYWNLADFRGWVSGAMSVVRELRRSFPGAGDFQWRLMAAARLADAKMTPKALIESLGESALKDLPQTN